MMTSWEPLAGLRWRKPMHRSWWSVCWCYETLSSCLHTEKHFPVYTSVCAQEFHINSFYHTCTGKYQSSTKSRSPICTANITERMYAKNTIQQTEPQTCLLLFAPFLIQTLAIQTQQRAVVITNQVH